MAATLKVRVIPRARRNEVAGFRQEALVVRLTAPPVEGAANRLLLRVLAERLGLRPPDLALVSGHTSREKVVCIASLSEAELAHRLS
ncbi:MAG: DUF167 domain-containing protein [Armatimonadetes bacterium]|nr:DUF167 domain-containing protein [Armatimonadota bacterium]